MSEEARRELDQAWIDATYEIFDLFLEAKIMSYENNVHQIKGLLDDSRTPDFPRVYAARMAAADLAKTEPVDPDAIKNIYAHCVALLDSSEVTERQLAVMGIILICDSYLSQVGTEVIIG